MNEHATYCVVFCSCPTEEHAEKIARSIIKEKLAACVQISPIRSFYKWKGEICTDEEHILSIKTKSVLYKDIEVFIAKNHPYEIPEIVMIPIIGGLENYFTWIDSVCR